MRQRLLGRLHIAVKLRARSSAEENDVPARVPMLAATRSFVSILASPLFAQIIADGAARIKASVTDERGQPYRECRIELLDDAKRVVADRKESGTFMTTFVLAPTPALYLLRIACEGSNQTFTSEPKLLGDPETSYRVPVDLGVIQLKRREHPPN